MRGGRSTYTNPLLHADPRQNMQAIGKGSMNLRFIAERETAFGICRIQKYGFEGRAGARSPLLELAQQPLLRPT
ncbi:MAG: hypothetical protein C5B57_08730 [Blastocatellia bacterium]|nr:MAG: hypothetical protein C5B57_08730 [Blastocatellia bacterium]